METKKTKKLASGVHLLEKEILRPGKWVDESGTAFELTKEDIAEFVAGTETLRAAGFRINAFPDHETRSSTAKLGVWNRVWQDEGGSARGEFEPRNAEAEEIALENDSSAFLVEDFDLGAFQVGKSMPRIDVVPQGAIVGTEPFKPLSLKLAAGLSVGRVRAAVAAAAPTKKEVPMSKLAHLMSQALGMPEGEEIDEERVIAELSLRGLRGLMSDQGAPADEEHPMEIEELEELEDELDDDEEVPKAMGATTTAAAGGELKLSSALGALEQEANDSVAKAALQRVAELEEGYLDREISKARKLAKASPIEAGIFKAIKAAYYKDRTAFGHEEAYSRAKGLLGTHVALSKARALQAGTRPERPTNKGAQDKAEAESGENPLLAARGWNTKKD